MRVVEEKLGRAWGSCGASESKSSERMEAGECVPEAGSTASKAGSARLVAPDGSRRELEPEALKALSEGCMSRPQKKTGDLAGASEARYGIRNCGEGHTQTDNFIWFARAP